MIFGDFPPIFTVTSFKLESAESCTSCLPMRIVRAGLPNHLGSLEASGDYFGRRPIDRRELVEGSRLYLPIPVDGGFLAIGDRHALQGDGEISSLAIECPMELVDVTINVLDDPHLSNPRADTPAGWITFGFHEDLNEAVVQALDGMLNLMQELYEISRVEAMALGSAVVDLRVTQIVKGVKGVHAVLPHGAVG